MPVPENFLGLVERTMKRFIEVFDGQCPWCLSPPSNWRDHRRAVVWAIVQVCSDLHSGKYNHSTGGHRVDIALKKMGCKLTHTPIPDSLKIPPPNYGNLFGLFDDERIDLIINTCMDVSYGFAKMKKAEGENFCFHPKWNNPAWELSSSFSLDERESDDAWWARRWQAAGKDIGWKGALKNPMVARKDSPIWAALGNGAGGYADTLKNPFPPFCFGSGKTWKDVKRDDCLHLWGRRGFQKTFPEKRELTPGERNIQEVLEQLGPEFRASLLAELEEAAGVKPQEAERETNRAKHGF